MQKSIYISTETYKIFEQQRDKAMIRYANKYKLPYALIKAIIQVESNNNFWAVRYEKHLKKAGWYNRTLRGIHYTVDYRYCSFGLMQVMYGIARHNGMIGSPFRLYNPDIGIKYGCKLLKKLMRRYKRNIFDVIAAYNQGNNRFYDLNKNGIKDKNERYYNQDYVNKVMRYYRKYYGE